MAGAYERDTRATQLRVYDYGDAIFTAYDRECHLLAMLNKSRGKPLKEVFASWRARTFGRTIDAAVAEGTDKTEGYNSRQAAMLKGWAQIFRSQGWHVTPTMEAVDQADVASEIAEQKTNDQEDFSRTVERILGSAQAQNDGSVGLRRTGGLFWWLSPAGSGSDAPPASVRTATNAYYTGALADLTETVFTDTILKAMFDQVKKPLVREVKAGLLLKNRMSAWGVGVNSSADQIATRVVNMSDLHKKWIGMIDFFQWDVGQVTTWLSVNLACTATADATPEWIESDYTPRSGLILDPSVCHLRYLRPLKSVEQDPTKGGGRRGYDEMEAMLCLDSPQGMGAIFTNT